MPPSMHPPAGPVSGAYQALYRATVREAASGGAALMSRLVVAARGALHAREAATRDLRERDAIAQSIKELNGREAALCKAYPVALLKAFENPEVVKRAVKVTTADVQFDQLELMDEVQVMTSVAMARTQQIAMLAAEASLAELNTLICATLGLVAVRPERNPLRPEIYVSALKTIVEDTRVPSATQLDWLSAMSAALGKELRDMYIALSAKLRQQGVAPAGYAVLQTPSSGGVGRGVAQEFSAPSSAEQPDVAAAASAINTQALASGVYQQPAASVRVRSADEALLTLDKLRRLLSGDLGSMAPGGRMETFARQFEQQFESGTAGLGPAHESDFDATVPAALDALTEMRQVERVVHTLEQRQRGGNDTSEGGPAAGVAGIRQSLRRNVRDIAQALSLEVVTLMVENMARDPRLLEPVQAFIRSMEPPLLRLALADPRFFSDKQHPARQLLHDVTHQSFAYESPQSSGFQAFIDEVRQAVAPLAEAPIDGAEPFEYALGMLRMSWGRAAQEHAKSSQQAVEVLKGAEARNLLAEKIAREIDAHPDSPQVPEVVINFLCGPWAQVVAQARIQGGAGSVTADKYQALISALLWSAHPELARKSVSKLTRLVPRLITTLREGLDTIQYPTIKTSAFLEALMGIHQLAFRGQEQSVVPPADPAAASKLRAQFVEQGDPWIAPEEAKSSNFVDLSMDIQPSSTTGVAVAASKPADQSAPTAADDTPEASAASAPAFVDELPLGSWIELQVNGEWVRTQLTWASPHGTLFLFTSAFGTTQSMTRRTRDKLVASGNLRWISDHPVVESALDAVARAALQNSMDNPTA